ncbi:MAG TPA: hypothetical protein DIT25_04580 [Candidatus Moranbacteria bacterium]|nr:hypothetical protein [Candidatus Moranbacteria bacterium]
MTNFNLIEDKISQTRKYLKIVERYKKYSRAEIEDNVDVRGMVERYLYLSVQSAIDLAETTISFKKLRKPTTMGESFNILEEDGIIDLELAKKMIAMTGFRNVVAHDYEKINYDIVYDILHNRLSDIEKFLTIVEKI